MDKSKWGAHETHCCSTHGCKYGDDDCPVVLGQVKQVYRCEDCPPILPEIINIDQLKALVYNGYIDWLNTNDEDKVTITTNDGQVLLELTAYQHEMVELIKRQRAITLEFEQVAQNPDLYIRKLKINDIKNKK